MSCRITPSLFVASAHLILAGLSVQRQRIQFVAAQKPPAYLGLRHGGEGRVCLRRGPGVAQGILPLKVSLFSMRNTIYPN